MKEKIKKHKSLIQAIILIGIVLNCPIFIDAQIPIFVFGENAKEIILNNEKQLYCEPTSFIKEPLKPTEDTKAIVLYQIKNPIGTWFRVAINKEPITNCVSKPIRDKIGFKYWMKEESVPKNIRSQILDVEQFSKDSLELQSFRVDGNYIKENVRECPSDTCEIEWMVGNGGIATVAEKEGDWFRIVVSNFDTNHVDLFGGEGWVYESLVPEKVKTYFSSQQQNQGAITNESTSTFTQKEEFKSKPIAFLSFFKNKDFQICLLIFLIVLIVIIVLFLFRKKIKGIFQSKLSGITLPKIKFKQKSFVASLPIILVIAVVVAGISYGAVEYRKTLKIISEAEQLTKEEKYNEAIGKLEFAKSGWVINVFGGYKQEIANEIENNKKLLEDKSEYSQGLEEFNKENWGKAKELLSKVSENSPYFQDAKNKIDEAQNKITEKQIAEAVGKTTEEMKQKTEEARKAAEETQRQIEAEKAKRIATEEQMKQLQEEVKRAKRAVKYVTANTNLLGLINYEVILNVLKGTIVTVIEEEVDWSHVKIGNQEGWLENRYLADSIPQAPDLASIIAQWRPLVAYVECDFRYSDTNQLYYQTSGSGVVLNFTLSPTPNSNYVTIVTNKHILTDDQGYGAYSCSIKLPGQARAYLSTNIFDTIKNVDGGTIEINNPDDYLKSLPWSLLCERHPFIGEKVVILGYPAIGTKADITATEGIISGYEGNYYITSAKIDQGNSGGAAILVEDNCFLGIPTYAILGKIESLGRILRVQTIWE